MSTRAPRVRGAGIANVVDSWAWLEYLAASTHAAPFVAASEDIERLDLPLADSLIYATTMSRGATLWTQDARFDGLPGVRYFARP